MAHHTITVVPSTTRVKTTKIDRAILSASIKSKHARRKGLGLPLDVGYTTHFSCEIPVVTVLTVAVGAGRQLLLVDSDVVSVAMTLDVSSRTQKGNQHQKALDWATANEARLAWTDVQDQGISTGVAWLRTGKSSSIIRLIKVLQARLEPALVLRLVARQLQSTASSCHLVNW